MPRIELTDSEAQALIQMLIGSNPILLKVIQQVQEQAAAAANAAQLNGSVQPSLKEEVQ